MNDGSTDDSLEQLNNKYFDNSNIIYKVINQSNKGTFLARWAGFKQSTGRYILFLDIDDCFEPNIFFELENAQYFNFDVTQFRFRKISSDNISISNLNQCRPNDYQNDNTLFPCDDGKYYLFDKCYSRDLFPSNILEDKFMKSTNFEDGALNAVILSEARTKLNLDKVLYNYILHSNSMCMKGHKNYINLINDYHLLWAMTFYKEDTFAFWFLCRSWYTLLLQKVFWHSKSSEKIFAIRNALRNYRQDAINKIKEYKILQINKSIRIKKEKILFWLFINKFYFLVIILSKIVNN